MKGRVSRFSSSGHRRRWLWSWHTRHRRWLWWLMGFIGFSSCWLKMASAKAKWWCHCCHRKKGFAAIWDKIDWKYDLSSGNLPPPFVDASEAQHQCCSCNGFYACLHRRKRRWWYQLKTDGANRHRHHKHIQRNSMLLMLRHGFWRLILKSLVLQPW